MVDIKLLREAYESGYNFGKKTLRKNKPLKEDLKKLYVHYNENEDIDATGETLDEFIAELAKRGISVNKRTVSHHIADNRPGYRRYEYDENDNYDDFKLFSDKSIEETGNRLANALWTAFEYGDKEEKYYTAVKLKKFGATEDEINHILELYEMSDSLPNNGEEIKAILRRFNH